jgi:hypothetical protein
MAPSPITDPGIAVLEAHLASDDEARAAIFHNNAVRLFPRFDRAATASASPLDPVGLHTGRP